MPDKRKHRGPHPSDVRLFAPKHHAALQSATAELSWLLSRGYKSASALKLVGDRHALTARQRQAVARSACSDQALEHRRSTELQPGHVSELWIDGFNVLMTVEVALGGGPVFIARDGCHRDIASVHGTYRRVAETQPAIDAFGQTLIGLGLERTRILLDAPVSNSGKLRALLCERLPAGLTFEVELCKNPDAVLVECDKPIATADSVVLDRAARWLNLSRLVVESLTPKTTPWLVDLSGTHIPTQ